MRLAAIWFLLLLAACVPRPSVPPTVPPASETVLLERLAEDARAFRSLQGLAKVRVERGGQSMGGTQVLLAEKPGRLRAETLSPFGQPLLLMATDGLELTVMIPSDGRFYRGEASARNVQRFTRLPLQLTDLVHILLYQVPIIGHDRRTLTIEEGSGYLLVLLDETGRRQELRFNRELHLVEVAYFIDADLQLRVRYDKFMGEAHPFPQSALLEMPALDAEASLVFSEVRTNVAIPAERFLLTPPPGAEILPIP
jgi:hypothetical protein